MTKRKKAQFIFLFFTVITLISLFIAYQLQPSQQNETTQTSVEEDSIEEVIGQVQEKDEEMSEDTNDISSNLRYSVDRAFKIFSTNDYHITAIGDSLTQGVGDESNNGGYVGVIQNKLADDNYRLTVDNFGHRGHRTDQLLNRLNEEEALEASIADADIVLLTIGANDLMKIVRDNFLALEEELFITEQVQYEQRLREIFTTLQSFNDEAEFFYIGFFNPFEGYFNEVDELTMILNNWNNAGKSLTEAYDQFHFIPINDLFLLEDVHLLAEDNFHPNSTGYLLMAERILTYIRPTLDTIHQERNTELEF